MSEALKKNKDLILADFCKYKHENEFVDKLVSIYAIINRDKDCQLRKFEKTILIYYMRYGYSSETKKIAEKQLKKTYETVTQATFYLSKKGYLIPSKTNMTKKTLNPDLIRLRDAFINGDKKIYAIGFKRN